MADREPGEKAVARTDFGILLAEVKGRIQEAQTRAVLAVNSELVRLYWDIGRMIHNRQRREGWGAAVIPSLARALNSDFPALKGFSGRNIGRMIAFYRAYTSPAEFLPPAVAKLLSQGEVPQLVARSSGQAVVQQPLAPAPDSLLWAVPWAHLCQEHNRLLAEYSFTGIDKPIGISTYELTRALPMAMRSALPTVEDIEAELAPKPVK